jgi:hypothetical protein
LVFLILYCTLQFCLKNFCSITRGITYSLRPQKSVVFACRETTLTKYIKIFINIYVTGLILLDRYLNLVFYKIYFETQLLHVFLQTQSNLWYENEQRSSEDGGSSTLQKPLDF